VLLHTVSKGGDLYFFSHTLLLLLLLGYPTLQYLHYIISGVEFTAGLPAVPY
jgi:hypothetical protein